MFDQGLIQRQKLGDLRDLIGRRFEHGDVVSVAPGDTLLIAFNRMRAADLAQLPVIEDGKLVGIIDESDILLKVEHAATQFKGEVGGTMTARVETLAPSAGMPALRDTLDRGLTAVIAEGGKFYGLITRYDLLNHLRRTLS
jgi:cystathionine beta-synthase